MKSLEQYSILKLALIAIFAMHSIPSIYTGDVYGFGKMYLDTQGFAPFGIYLAWMIKLSHIGLIFSILTDRFLKVMGWITIAVLVVGIIMVHWPDGWFVVGGGRNGIEFNVLLIACLLTLMYPEWQFFKTNQN
ncbi:MAG: DoxX family protein [Saprospiraceae bacterium]|jgi:putative oxidoreductase|nr:DoxX family protein [Saprospiraceae bacterium]